MFTRRAHAGGCVALSLPFVPPFAPGAALAGRGVTLIIVSPAESGRGYAGSLVHELSTIMLSEGGAACVSLFTDMANPISSLYARIGFVPFLNQSSIKWDTR